MQAWVSAESLPSTRNLMPAAATDVPGALVRRSAEGAHSLLEVEVHHRARAGDLRDELALRNPTRIGPRHGVRAAASEVAAHTQLHVETFGSKRFDSTCVAGVKLAEQLVTDDLLDDHQLRSRSPATCTAATAAASAAAATAATARLRRRLLLLVLSDGIQSASGGALNLEAGFLLAGVGIADIESLRLRPAGEPIVHALTIKVVASRRVVMANVAWTTLIADVLVARALGPAHRHSRFFLGSPLGPFRVFPGLSGSLSGSFRAQSTRKRPGAFPGPFRVFRVFREARGIPGGPESTPALRASRNSPQVIYGRASGVCGMG